MIITCVELAQVILKYKHDHHQQINEHAKRLRQPVAMSLIPDQWKEK